MHLTHPKPSPTPSVENLSSTKLVPGAKKVGDHHSEKEVSLHHVTTQGGGHLPIRTRPSPALESAGTSTLEFSLQNHEKELSVLSPVLITAAQAD